MVHDVEHHGQKMNSFVRVSFQVHKGLKINEGKSLHELIKCKFVLENRRSNQNMPCMQYVHEGKTNQNKFLFLRPSDAVGMDL